MPRHKKLLRDSTPQNCDSTVDVFQAYQRLRAETHRHFGKIPFPVRHFRAVCHDTDEFCTSITPIIMQDATNVKFFLHIIALF